MSTETQAKHTPGPWFIRKANPGNCDLYQEGYGAIADFMVDGPNEKMDAEAVANAHLCAAAPDLLEALIRATNLLRQSGYEAGVYNSAIDQADAAIAKAEGRQ